MKTKAKRFSYLLYYLRKLDRKKLRHFLSYASTETGRSKAGLLRSAIAAVFRYNISILDYFFFRFFEKDSKEKKLWAGTGFMYEYQKLMNPLKVREVLENKILFCTHFSDYIKRDYAVIQPLEKEKSKALFICEKP